MHVRLSQVCLSPAYSLYSLYSRSVHQATSIKLEVDGTPVASVDASPVG